MDANDILMLLPYWFYHGWREWGKIINVKVVPGIRKVRAGFLFVVGF